MKNPFLKFIMIFALIFITYSCDDDEDEIITPSIESTTTNANVVKTFTSITISGNVTSNGGETLSARGVAWGTNPNPTIADNKTEELSDNFTSEISNLLPNTDYYFRVYATNSAGTEYGSQLTFRTQSLAGTTWVYDINATTSNGNQTGWVAELTFNADGTTFYTEPDSPGVYDYNGTWEVIGNNVNVVVDETGSWFLELNGTISGNSMSGTWEFNGTQTWTAIPK